VPLGHDIVGCFATPHLQAVSVGPVRIESLVVLRTAPWSSNLSIVIAHVETCRETEGDACAYLSESGPLVNMKVWVSRGGAVQIYSLPHRVVWSACSGIYSPRP
jgi:hypothetical protein